jgi:hypothetical protein
MRERIGSFFRGRALLLGSSVAAVIAAAMVASIGCSVGGDSANSSGIGGSSGGVGGLGGAYGLGGASAGLGGSSGTISDAGAGTDASSDGPSGSGGAGGAAGCLVLLEAVAPSSFEPTPVEAGEGSRFRVRGSVAGATAAHPAWQWTVRFGDAVIPTTAIDDAGSTVDFPITNVGRYQVTAQIVGEPTCSAFKVAQAVPPQPATFVLRTIADGFPVQDKRISLVDPQPLSLTLDTGVMATIFPRQVAGHTALASYVRVSNPFSSFIIEGDTTQRPLSTWLLSDVSYDLLIIPLSDVAPDLITGTQAQWQSGLFLDDGIPVTARTRAGDGTAVVGARMILRRGARPSTVGTSDDTGAMGLMTRAGTLAAYIVPPATSGLAQVTVGAGTDAGIVLDPAATSLDLQMTWSAVTSSMLAVNVRGIDGATTMPGARVRVKSQGGAAPVGTLRVQAAGGAAVSLPALGATEVEVVSDAGGAAVFPSLPIGTYDVTIVPPVGTSPAAITAIPVTLAAAGTTQTVSLVRKVTLAGTLLAPGDSAGTRITAIDTSDTAAGSTASAIVGADGSYALLVDPLRTYQLVAEPAAGAPLARMVLGTVRTNNGPTIVLARALPAGRPFTGQISSGLNPVGGALIQVFCPNAPSLKCPDPTFPVATAITRTDGTFDLLLPDPDN